MIRVPDWPSRLSATLRDAERRPFDDIRWNCGRFVLACIEACTGIKPVWRSLPTLEQTADSAGFQRIPAAFAAIGDVVLARDPDRLGVVIMAGEAAFVSMRGLIRIPAASCATAWRIG